MFHPQEILSTLEMLRQEHLDVRTGTLGIHLFDCAGPDARQTCAAMRAKILQKAADLVAVCDEIGDKYGIPVVNKRIAVSPIAVAAAPLDADGMRRVAHTLDAGPRVSRVERSTGVLSSVAQDAAVPVVHTRRSCPR